MKTPSRHLFAAVLAALPLALLAADGPAAGARTSLFDGKSMNAWRIFKTDNAPKMCDTPGAKDCWEIVNGALRKDGHANDIASKEQFGDFELELDWKIGNDRDELSVCACDHHVPETAGFDEMWCGMHEDATTSYECT